VAESETQTPDAEIAVTPAELRAPKLPLQSLGGYSRGDTDRLLDRAAKALDEAHERLAEEARRRTASVEQTVGEVLVTAHHAAESVRDEAQQQADAVLVAARASAQELVDKADAVLVAARASAQELVEKSEREAQEIEAAKARVAEALAEEHEKARASREDVEREIAVLQADARRVRLTIDEFRDQWLNLISETLRQLELRFPNAEAAADEIETLQDDLRSRLTTVESAPEPGKSSPDKAS
jgi:chromosome segregation ATPase